MNREQFKHLRALIERAAKEFDDTTALEFPEAFPKWKVDYEYKTDDRLRYNNVLYKVLQNHTSQSTWTPDVTPSLYVRVDNPHEEWPEWIQPLGSTDAYPLGAKVSHNEKHWVSNVNANIWEPGVYGWDEHE